MNIATIEEAVSELVKQISPETFIFQLLAAYGKPKASITRLQKGDLNLSKQPGEVIWKKNVLFCARDGQRPHSSENPSPSMVRETPAIDWDLHALADRLRKSQEVSKHGLRFVITTDWETLLAVDTKTAETLDIPIGQLPKHAHFFLPWAGQEKHKSHNESQADIKAAYKMGKLYDQICLDNPGMSDSDTHALNVFLSRLLFCFFAEDTQIFPTEGMFTSSIASHTQEDGSDLDSYLDKLFDAMNCEDRSAYPAYLQAFPYVNGGLFSDNLRAPRFSRLSRKIILECGDLDWSEINPDIFGSMMQAVVNTERRDETGMHYTSVSNIMKVIDPLFLIELKEEFAEHVDNPKSLERLRARLNSVKVFDPACGSGNFLIISFKELRKLEMDIFLRLRELNPNYQTLFTLPQIQLTQFYGIELDDFAHEIAVLSMWLAEHQMNVKFKQSLGIFVPALPLKPSGRIVCGNATRLDWDAICPKAPDSEVYLLGNPPYTGARKQDERQKEDMRIVFEDRAEYKDTDYVSCWLLKAANYVHGAAARFAFVATNSISQGEQVAYIWPRILDAGLEIGFAHQPFKWTNNAKGNAGITCVIVGVRNASAEEKRLFADGKVKTVSNITPYLTAGRTVFVHRADEAISQLPPMMMGSMPRDGGHLILSPSERQELIEQYPQSATMIRRLCGSDEFINGQERWCLWIADEQLKIAKSIPPIADRIERVYKFRSSSEAKTTQGYSTIPHKFAQRCSKETNSILIPCHSSERREYIPFGFFDQDTVIPNSALIVPDPEPWVFAAISSKMHNVWVRAVAGRIRTDFRYSARICYNTFPLVELTDKQKESLATHAFNLLSEREHHSEKTIAKLYDPDGMPANLKQAHYDLDTAVERCYRSRPFNDDAQRLEYLFQLYEEMTANA